MNPHQKNKVDLNVRQIVDILYEWNSWPCQSLSADEQRLFRMYGKLPNKKDLLQNKLKVNIFHLFYIRPLSCDCFPLPQSVNTSIGTQVFR